MEQQNAKPLLAALASRQAGRVARYQLRHLEVPDSRIASWLRRGYLQPVLPAVYAVGCLTSGIEADLWSAVLYAGPGAMLSHLTAAWWHGLIAPPGGPIHVSTPLRARSLPRITVHARRACERVSLRGLPVSAVEQTLLDLAACAAPLLVRRALAELDFRQQLDAARVRKCCRSGVAGSAILRKALAAHMPQLARANSQLEVDFLLLCERHGIALPQVNVPMHGYVADAYWASAGLVVELDGGDNHSSRAQIRRDRAKELAFRRRGLQVVRYDWALVHEQPGSVAADLRAQLGGRA